MRDAGWSSSSRMVPVAELLNREGRLSADPKPHPRYRRVLGVATGVAAGASLVVAAAGTGPDAASSVKTAEPVGSGRVTPKTSTPTPVTPAAVSRPRPAPVTVAVRLAAVAKVRPACSPCSSTPSARVRVAAAARVALPVVKPKPCPPRAQPTPALNPLPAQPAQQVVGTVTGTAGNLLQPALTMINP